MMTMITAEGPAEAAENPAKLKKVSEKLKVNKTPVIKILVYHRRFLFLTSHFLLLIFYFPAFAAL